jgi:hypothetical protein
MILCAGVSLLAAQVASARTLYVTSDGVDSGSCGAKATPCRSISQAIENASAGDTIGVGAGRYGNISGDGTFSHPGDEHPQTGRFGGFDGPTGCMICVDKPLTIQSLHGASVTVIEGIPSTDFPANVLILSYNVHFGTAGAGFTVTGGNTYGVRIDQGALGSGGEFHPAGVSISIAGNRDVGDGTGFSFEGIPWEDDLCNAPVPCLPAAISFSGNEATSNAAAGFAIVLNAQIRIGDGPVLLQNNVARGAGTGFAVHPGGQDDIGEAISASNVSVIGNVAIHNTYGFDLDLAGDIERNTAVANANTGFLVVPYHTVFRSNTTVGNRGPGMIVNFSADWFDGGTDPTRKFQSLDQNNFYGNDRGRPVFVVTAGGAQLDPGPSAHCGILNVGAVATLFGPAEVTPPPKEVLQAPNDFWGAPTGPSHSGPADAVAGACDQNGGTTTAPNPVSQGFTITTAP